MSDGIDSVTISSRDRDTGQVLKSVTLTGKRNGTAPMRDVLDEADRHPASQLNDEIAYMKESVIEKANRASRRSDKFVVGDSIKFLTLLFADEAGELDCEISISVKAKPHVEKEEG